MYYLNSPFISSNIKKGQAEACPFVYKRLKSLLVVISDPRIRIILIIVCVRNILIVVSMVQVIRIYWSIYHLIFHNWNQPSFPHNHGLIQSYWLIYNCWNIFIIRIIIPTIWISPHTTNQHCTN